jgi:ATP-dependent protease Clp ATPase subunit
VDTLVSGPGVYICSECVSLCTQILEDRSTDAPPSLPWYEDLTVDEVLGLLPSVASVGAQAELNLVGWVRRARSLGVTWARIGETLGMTRQSAWERFSGEE